MCFNDDPNTMAAAFHPVLSITLRQLIQQNYKLQCIKDRSPHSKVSVLMTDDGKQYMYNNSTCKMN